MTSSEESLQWAREMISRCIRRHMKCGPGLASVLPRRVLKIGSDLSVKLVETVQNENARYVCISHRWGGAEEMSTTTTTLEAFKNGIAGYKLPKMFQDAVAYTQRMGIRYIWIDSLCIIQDDSLDWQAESSKMGSYYANSFVTLAATKSTGNQDSLFSTLQPKHRHARLGGRSFRKNVNIYARRALLTAIEARPTTRRCCAGHGFIRSDF